MSARVPVEILSAVDEFAKRKGMTRSQAVRAIFEQALGSGSKRKRGL
jgi:metal-responsive CopG/Arc/MetJ family transcriptional regulator